MCNSKKNMRLSRTQNLRLTKTVEKLQSNISNANY